MMFIKKCIRVFIFFYRSTRKKKDYAKITVVAEDVFIVVIIEFVAQDHTTVVVIVNLLEGNVEIQDVVVGEITIDRDTDV